MVHIPFIDTEIDEQGTPDLMIVESLDARFRGELLSVFHTARPPDLSS